MGTFHHARRLLTQCAHARLCGTIGYFLKNKKALEIYPRLFKKYVRGYCPNQCEGRSFLYGSYPNKKAVSKLKRL